MILFRYFEVGLDESSMSSHKDEVLNYTVSEMNHTHSKEVMEKTGRALIEFDIEKDQSGWMQQFLQFDWI